jgi:hypothetical protein
VTPLPPTIGGPGGREWDTSWIERIRGRHRAVFDVAGIDDGISLFQAAGYLRHVTGLFGAAESDMSVVVVCRHDATPMLLTDAIWAKYGIAEETNTKELRTGVVATRNIFLQAVDAQGAPVSDARPTASIRSLMYRGVIFIGCDQALRGFSYPLALKTTQHADAVHAELREGLVPGAILLPTGIFATLTAQAAGCGLFKSP